MKLTDRNPINIRSSRLFRWFVIGLTYASVGGCGLNGPVPSYTVSEDLAEFIAIQSCRNNKNIVYCTAINRTPQAVDLGRIGMQFDCYNKVGTKIDSQRRGYLVLDPNGSGEIQTCYFKNHVPGRLHFYLR